MLSAVEMPIRRIPEVTVRPQNFQADSHTVVMLGLDGADWRILEPMIKAGLLPNLELVLAGGAAGILRTDFAHSPTSWTTIASGRSASVHGLTPDLPWGSLQMEPQEIHVRRIWEIARERGRPIAVYNYMFCRVRPAGDWGWIPNIPIRYSNELPTGLTTRGCPTNGSGLDIDNLFLKACLLGRRPTDLTIIMAYETDGAAHTGMIQWLRRWHPEMFAKDDPMPGRGDEDVLTMMWIDIDQGLGQVLNNMPEGAHLVICSDHGFGSPRASPMKIMLGREALSALWLERESIDQGEQIAVDTPLGRIKVTRSWEPRAVRVAHIRGRSSPEEAQAMVESLLIRKNRSSDNDWRAEIEERLEQALGPDADQLRIQRLDDGGLSISPDPAQLERIVVISQTPDGQAGVDMNFAPGDHGPGDDGIILIFGPKVIPGARFQGASLVDVTPTILWLMGLPVGRDMPGSVLTDAFTAQALADDPIRYVGTYETTPVKRDPISLGERLSRGQGMDPETIERLKALGYLH